MLTIDASSLLSYYQAKSGAAAAAGASASGSSGAKKNPTPPWSIVSTAPKMSALADMVMRGGKFIDTEAAKLDASLKTADDTRNYKNLFGLYQAVNALEGLAERAGAKGVSDLDKRLMNNRFEKGMKEIQAFLSASPFKGFDIVQGAAVDKMQSTVGAKAQVDSYVTRPLHTGNLSDEVEAFQGDTVFSMNVKGSAGTDTTVQFDLSKMGSTPRSMSNVVLYMNDKLQAAGVVTRIANERIPGVAQTITAGGKTVNLGGEPKDSFAFRIKGIASETITFTAPDPKPAVYISQLSGKTTGVKPSPVSQFFKLDGSDPDAARIVSQTLGKEVTGLKASATAPDGSVYVLADIAGKTADGQPIKGDSDVALLKYDSAGNLLFTRTLGAGDAAKGYALAVSADGSQVAIGGSVTGALDSNDLLSTSSSGADSFVSVFNAAGDELWTQRRGAVSGDDNVEGLAFGTDGKVYLTGTTRSAMPGAGAIGSTDGYIAAFTPTKTLVPGSDPIWSATSAFTTQFGTTGTDRASGMVVQGSSAYVASVEDGRAIVRRYDLQPTGAPVLAATRDLGDLMGGDIAGIGVGPGGEILIAGSTHNGALNAGTVTTPYGDEGEAFVAKLSADLAPAGSDRLTYYSGTGDTDVGAMTVSDGKVYITGRVAGPPSAASGDAPTEKGYAVAIDPTTGAVGWSKQFDGLDGVSTPTAISVDPAGVSALDRLGLPKGTIDYSSSSNVVSSTSLRPGDQFKLRTGGGAALSITIEAGDTYQTLARKISRATNFSAIASTVTVDGRTQIRIVPASASAEIQVIAGADGRNALTGLGLVEGVIDKDVGVVSNPKVGQAKSADKIYGLKLPSTLSIDGTNARSAQTSLMGAITTIQAIYKDMIATVAPIKSGANSGQAPAYITARLANYQEALSRLGG